MLRWTPLVLALLLAAPAESAEVQVEDGWVRLMPGGPSAGYFRLTNPTDSERVLTGARCPGFAETTLHESVEQGGTSRMRHVEQVAINAGGTAVFAPGGLHLMLTEPTAPPEVGSELTCTLHFADGTSIEAALAVRPPYADGP